MSRLTSVGGEATRVGTGATQFSTKATLKLADGLKATVAHKVGSQAAVLTLTGKSWEVAHDSAKKDTRLKYKTKVGKSTLVVKQHVPGGKWALVPNPAFELTRGGLLGKDSKLVCSYDFLDRASHAEQTLYGGDDKQHKAWTKWHSKAGASAGIRSKLERGPLLHSAAAAYRAKAGWHLTLKSKFEDGATKVKTTYAVKTDTLTIAAKHKPKIEGDGAQPTLTLAMVVPVTERTDPRVTLGLKWDL